MELTQILQKIKSVVYTKSEIDSMGGGTSLDTTIRSKANANHTHDDRYYTESEIDTKLSNKADKDLSNLDENGRKVIADGNLTKSGWTKLANGLILQWGSHYHGDIADTTARPISFNIPFPNNCLQVIVSTSDTTGGCGIALRANDEPTTTGFLYTTSEWPTHESRYVIQSVTVLWFAVGY